MVYFNMKLTYDTPKNFNPAAVFVLNDILTRGTLNKNEEEFDKYQEDNNVAINASLSPTKFSLAGSANAETIKDTLKKACGMFDTNLKVILSLLGGNNE